MLWHFRPPPKKKKKKKKKNDHGSVAPSGDSDRHHCLRLLLRQLLLKRLRIWLLTRSRGWKPLLNIYFFLHLLMFLHCSPVVTCTSLPALSLQHTEVELYCRRNKKYKKKKIIVSQKLRTVKFFKRIRMVAARLTNLSVIDPGTLENTRIELRSDWENMLNNCIWQIVYTIVSFIFLKIYEK